MHRHSTKQLCSEPSHGSTLTSDIYLQKERAEKAPSILHTMCSPLSSVKNWPEPAQKPYGVWLDCLVISDIASLGDPTTHWC